MTIDIGSADAGGLGSCEGFQPTPTLFRGHPGRPRRRRRVRLERRFRVCLADGGPVTGGTRPRRHFLVRSARRVAAPAIAGALTRSTSTGSPRPPRGAKQARTGTTGPVRSTRPCTSPGTPRHRDAADLERDCPGPGHVLRDQQRPVAPALQRGLGFGDRLLGQQGVGQRAAAGAHLGLTVTGGPPVAARSGRPRSAPAVRGR